MRSTAVSLPRRCSRSLTLVAGALATLTTLAGCQPDKGPGSVVVTYVLGNNKACEEVGVTDVRAFLYKGTLADPSVQYIESVDCEDGEIVLESIPPDTYNIWVVGYDANDVETFDNLGQSSSQRTVEVFEAAESSTDADLTARPAVLGVKWRLGAEGFGNCDSVGIARFEVAAYQTGGGTVLLTDTLDCDAPGNEEGFRIIADPNRALNGVLFGEVGIQAIAADGSDLGSPAVFVFDPVGAGYSVQLAIECTADSCTPA